MNIPQFLLLAGLVGSARSAQSQEPATWTSPIEGDTSLQALIAQALQRNPSIAQRQAAVRAATLRIRPAGTLPDPMLTLGVMNLVPKFGFSFNRSDFTEADVELMQEIPWPGTLGARAGVARAASAGARADEAAVRRELTAAMAAAYYRLRYAVTALRTVRRQRELLEAAVQLSTTRYATGAAPQSDPLQAKLARDRLQSEAFALESELTASLAAVNALRNRAPGDTVPVTPLGLAAVRAAVAPLPPSDSLIAAALTAHPRLAARRAVLEQATRTIRVERLSARPDFTLGVRYGYRPAFLGEFNLPDFFSAFVGLRLPIWAWRKQNRLADAARADSTGAAAELRDVELQLSREVTETAARVQAAQQRLVLLVDGVLPTARGTVESVLRTYQVGRTEFLTLLSVEDARYRAELEAAAVAADYQALLVMLRQLTAGESQP
ncbi:MAG: TolC family protein [Gemmatimonadales bacterium]